MDDILKIVASSIAENDPIVHNSPSCDTWYIPKRVALSSTRFCELKLAPTNSKSRLYKEEIIEELVLSTPLIKKESKSILDSILPCDKKLANQMAHKYLLEEFKEEGYEKIPSKLIETFNDNNQSKPYNNLWTTQSFDSITGLPCDLQSEVLKGNDERLEIIEENTKSNDNSTKDRYCFCSDS